MIFSLSPSLILDEDFKRPRGMVDGAHPSDDLSALQPTGLIKLQETL
jgi:hypothetical protein